MPPWHAMVSKIYVEKDELEKVRKIMDEIPNMMRSNPNVYLEEQQPYCEVSLGNYFELTIGCYLKQAVCIYVYYFLKHFKPLTCLTK